MPRFTTIAVIILVLFSEAYVMSQTRGINRDQYRISIRKTDNPINIDGVLDEEPWMTAERTTEFQRVTPTDTGMAIAKTEVMLTYDKSNLYLGIICHDPTPGKRPVESLRRDFSFMNNDNFMFFLNTYNDIELPSPYNDAKLLLIGPRFDFTFTDNLLFTNFVQYNNQIDNLNLNLRFQWRFAPVSDLFIVYTENSWAGDILNNSFGSPYAGDLKAKNRGLVVKLSYWFN